MSGADDSSERRAWDMLLCGDVGAVRVSSMLDDAEARAAWRTALDAARWHAMPGTCTFPRRDLLAPLVEAGSPVARSAACLACAWAVRACVLTFDYAALAQWTALATALAHGLDGTATQAWVLAVRAWERLAVGEHGAAAALATEAAAVARATDTRPVVIEATALRALAAQNDGALEPAVAMARVALRMARTEELPQWQYLTALVLARARRLCGHPHLAVRILRAVRRVAPAPWRAWTTLELLLASDPLAPTQPERSDAASPWDTQAGVRDVASLCAGALASVVRSECPEERRAGAAVLREHTGAWHLVRSDVLGVLAAVDPEAPDDGAPPEVIEWRRGRSGILPPRLHGLSLIEDAGGGGRRATYLIVRPGAERRRCLEPGARVAVSRGAVLLSSTTPRIEAAIASLAMAGVDGIAAEDLFLAVYGFHYQPDIHRTALKVLLHRVRSHLDHVAIIVRRHGRVTLVAQTEFVVGDACGGRALESMVLGAIARLERASARQAAEALRVPSRTVQAALHTLVEEGAVVAIRDGKRMLYGVEDTSFSEPTRW